jgi:hypothetical protein
MAAPAATTESSLPPEVAALGVPEQEYGANPALITTLWCLSGMLFVVAFMFGLVAVRPFGQNPPPPAVGIGGFLVVGVLAVGFIGYIDHLRSRRLLLFPQAVAEVRPPSSKIVRFENVGGVEVQAQNFGSCYRITSRDGQALTIDSTTHNSAQLGEAIAQRVAGLNQPATAPTVNPTGGAEAWDAFNTPMPGASPSPQVRRTGGNWFSPTITDAYSARQAAKQGVGAAGWCAGVTAVLALATFAGVHLFNITGWALLDAALFAIIAWGISRMSRFAAVAGLALYAIESLAMLATSGPTGVPMRIILLVMFVNAVRGTFAFHKYSTATSSTSYPPTPPVIPAPIPPVTPTAPAAPWQPAPATAQQAAWYGPSAPQTATPSMATAPMAAVGWDAASTAATAATAAPMAGAPTQDSAWQFPETRPPYPTPQYSTAQYPTAPYPGSPYPRPPYPSAYHPPVSISPSQGMHLLWVALAVIGFLIIMAMMSVSAMITRQYAATAAATSFQNSSNVIRIAPR